MHTVIFQEDIDAEVAKVVAQKDTKFASIVDEKDAEISMLRVQLAAVGIAAGSN